MKSFAFSYRTEGDIDYAFLELHLHKNTPAGHKLIKSIIAWEFNTDTAKIFKVTGEYDYTSAERNRSGKTEAARNWENDQLRAENQELKAVNKILLAGGFSESEQKLKEENASLKIERDELKRKGGTMDWWAHHNRGEQNKKLLNENADLKRTNEALGNANAALVSEKFNRKSCYFINGKSVTADEMVTALMQKLNGIKNSI